MQHSVPDTPGLSISQVTMPKAMREALCFPLGHRNSFSASLSGTDVETGGLFLLKHTYTFSLPLDLGNHF